MSRLAVAVIEGEESRIRETVWGEVEQRRDEKRRGREEGEEWDKRREAAVTGIVDSWTQGESQDVGTPEQRDTRIVGQ